MEVDSSGLAIELVPDASTVSWIKVAIAMLGFMLIVASCIL
jgi:hypothetical protein